MWSVTWGVGHLGGKVSGGRVSGVGILGGRVSYHTPGMIPYPQTTKAGGKHPTGMNSCFRL